MSLTSSAEPSPQNMKLLHDRREAFKPAFGDAGSSSNGAGPSAGGNGFGSFGAGACGGAGAPPSIFEVVSTDAAGSSGEVRPSYTSPGAKPFRPAFDPSMDHSSGGEVRRLRTQRVRTTATAHDWLRQRPPTHQQEHYRLAYVD